MLYASNSGTSNDDINASLKKFNSQESRKNAFSKALSSVFEKYKETSTVIRQNNQVIANNANAVGSLKKSVNKGFRYLFDMFQGFHQESTGNQKILIEQNTKIIELLKDVKEDSDYQIMQHNKTQALIICDGDSLKDSENG